MTDSNAVAGNPYLAALDGMVSDIMARDVAAIKSESMGMAHLNADNDWIYKTMADWALLLAYAWNAPQSAAFRRADVWAQMEKLVRRIVDGAQNGKWWRELSGTGDDNINRFTLLPMTDIFLRVGCHFDPELQKKYQSLIEQAAAEQVESHHIKTRCRGEYPNMDVYFMLIMEESSRILRRGDYHSLAIEYLGYLEASLFPDGGFVYYRGTNECENYHQLNIIMLARFFELTQSRRVLDLLRRTLPYYPNAIEPSGVAEYYTDPFWKHVWVQARPHALEIMATLFPEAPEAGTHRFLANVLRRIATQFDAIYLVFSMEYWMPGSGTPPRDAWVRHDASIRGPRGRFGAFSWAGTTGVCPDTLVGAMVAPDANQVSALAAVGPDVVLANPPVKDPGALFYGRRHGTSAYVCGHNYPRRVVVGANWASLAAWSPLYVGGIGWNALLPDSGWQTHQVWWMGANRLIGMLAVEPAHAGREPAKSVNIYARLGGACSAVPGARDLFAHGDLRLRVVHHTFANCALKPGYRFYLDAEPTRTEIVLSTPVADAQAPSCAAILEIYPAGAQPSEIAPLPAGQGSGFNFTDGGAATIVVFNASRDSVICAALATAQGRTYRAGGAYPVDECSATPATGLVAPAELVIHSSAVPA